MQETSALIWRFAKRAVSFETSAKFKKENHEHIFVYHRVLQV